MSTLSTLPQLPITVVLEQLQQTLTQRHELVLEAPPGAGKTTLVPLSLLNEPWLQGQRIIMLEPRRMAARNAAQRMAFLLGEQVGHTVGYRVRQDTKISKHTRIEVITEGILTRMLMQDPSLEGVGLVIFDEFHERSIDADFGLALTLQGRELFREADNPLRIMVMSATLDGAAVAQLLSSAKPTPVIRSEGKMFPVEMIYGKAKRYDEDIIARVCNTILTALKQHSGSLLVFLPGQGEINKVLQRLKPSLSTADNSDTMALPLYGALPFREQQKAIEPIPGQRKIVLATDIAETSLTIEGITVVIDAGLTREPQFDPATGMTRLHTRRISQDSSVQRMGRAGRLAPGHCYRLWSEEQQRQLAPQSTPQILQADLAPLVLQILAWGIDDINELQWLDLPPSGPLQQARDLLAYLGAITKPIDNAKTSEKAPDLSGWRVTPHGELMATMPTHPRLAHMLLVSTGYHLQSTAAALAALLSDRHPLSRDYGVDLAQPLAVVMGDIPCHSQHRAWLKRTQQQAKTFKQLLNNNKGPTTSTESVSDDSAIGLLLASAYPDRIAHSKPNNRHHYQLSNGRIATLDKKDTLGNQQWLAIAELGGTIKNGSKNSNDRIYAACHFDSRLLDNHLCELVTEKDSLQWDDTADRFIAETVRSINKLVIARSRIDRFSAEAKRSALIELIQKRGLNVLPWTPSSRQWQARVALLYTQGDAQLWPNVADDFLLQTLEHWLGPYLDPITKLTDFKKLNLQEILNSLLPWPLPQQLKEQAPTHFEVPSGSNKSIDYSVNPPVLKVKLQEMFGCEDTPSIANGKVKLMLHLLSPAQRPLQVTQDLAGFWQSSYFEVQKDMKGRYPKHPWPDKPQQALPTKYTKHRPKK